MSNATKIINKLKSSNNMKICNLLKPTNEEEEIIKKGTNIIEEMSNYLKVKFFDNFKKQLDLLEIIPEQEEKLINSLPKFS